MSDVSDLLGGDPAEVTAPVKPRKRKAAKLPEAEAQVAEQISAAEESVSQAVSDAEITPQVAEIEPLVMREVEVTVSPQGAYARSIPTDPLPSHPMPKFKYAYQRIEWQRRVDAAKG